MRLFGGNELYLISGTMEVVGRAKFLPCVFEGV